MSFQTPSPLSSLPGTSHRPRGLFVDRWGTLMELPEGSPCARFDQVRFFPGAIDALFRAHQAGWNVYLIGNEDAVARGRLSDRTWKRLEEDLMAHLTAQGVRVQRNYCCLDDPQGKGSHRRHSVFQLPNTGLLFHANQMDGVILGESWVVGDSTLELAAGARAGCKIAAVRTGLAASDGEFQIEPDFTCDDLAGMVDALLASEAYSRPA